MQIQDAREVELALAGRDSVRSPHQITSGRSGGVKSLFTASGAFRAERSDRVVDRRRYRHRATRSFSAITLATVFTLTR
jgi:hypothetical protein